MARDAESQMTSDPLKVIDLGLNGDCPVPDQKQWCRSTLLGEKLNLMGLEEHLWSKRITLPLLVCLVPAQWVQYLVKVDVVDLMWVNACYSVPLSRDANVNRAVIGDGKRIT